MKDELTDCDFKARWALLAAKCPLALDALEQVLRIGEDLYPDDRWRQQGRIINQCHWRDHVRMFFSAFCDEDHEAHAACRNLFDLQLREERKG